MKKMQYIAPSMKVRDMQAEQLLAAVSVTISDSDVDGSEALGKDNDIVNNSSVWDD